MRVALLMLLPALAAAEPRHFICAVPLQASEGAWVEMDTSDAGGIHRVVLTIAGESFSELLEVIPMPGGDAMVSWESSSYSGHAFVDENVEVTTEYARAIVRDGRICAEDRCFRTYDALTREGLQDFYDDYLTAMEGRSDCQETYE